MSTISVAALWRYPVKSMAGESLRQSAISVSGLDGDRAYAMVDGENRVGSAKLVKTFGALLHWQAGFRVPFQRNELTMRAKPHGLRES